MQAEVAEFRTNELLSFPFSTMASPTQDSHQKSTSPPPIWTYPTRFCRICREDVAPTITMYPPGLPPYLQKPIVEYVNTDEYGRLIKPCLCRGGMRYIHELCLLRSRTENNRVGSMWKCHECGHKFNFQKLAVQRWLGSKYSSTVLTIVVMITIMFSLGFIADPIINLYADPYDTLVGDRQIWKQVKVRTPVTKGAAWTQHFSKGFVSMGLVGFLKTLVLNPIHWWNYRQSGLVSSRTSTSGRDRAVNISWIAVVIGVCSAFYFFYRWVETFIQKTLQRVGNNIVNTQLPGDDDDLKPPPGWKPEIPSDEQSEKVGTTSGQTTSSSDQSEDSNAELRQRVKYQTGESQQSKPKTATDDDGGPVQPLAGSWVEEEIEDSEPVGQGSATRDAISQGWSFADL